MDIEVAARHVPGLLQFKERLEKMMAAFEAGAGPGASPLEDVLGRLSQLEKDNADLRETVAVLQQRADASEQKVTLVVEFKDGLQPIVDQLATFAGMVQWFGENREGLEILLSIDGMPDKATTEGKPQDGSSSAGDGAASSGTGQTSGGADAPVTDPAAPAPAPLPAPEPQDEPDPISIAVEAPPEQPAAAPAPAEQPQS